MQPATILSILWPTEHTEYTEEGCMPLAVLKATRDWASVYSVCSVGNALSDLSACPAEAGLRASGPLRLRRARLSADKMLGYFFLLARLCSAVATDLKGSRRYMLHAPAFQVGRNV